jgi:hypothetical protein
MVLAVTVLVAAGITVAALSLGGPSRPAVKLQVTNPTPAPSGPMAPATSGPAGARAPQGTPTTPTVITPPPRAYTVSPPPPAPAHAASPSPPGAVEVAKCPLNVKCTLP